MRSRIRLAAFLAVAGVVAASPCPAGDWPMWRLKPDRIPVLAKELPPKLFVQWTRVLPSPRAAWPKSQHKLQFDASYEPVVAGRRIFVPSMVRDSVTAYDTRTGRELWRFYAGGPVRFAPVAWKGRLYFVSDDGCLYCLDAATGERKWRFRGGPDGRKVIGNDRLVSAWPARGAPLVVDDPPRGSGRATVYFGASIWPFMGTFLYALDAETGREIWCNSGSGSIWMQQPHGGAVSFAAVAPQGYLAAAGGKLFVPCGRASPAVFDRRTGRFEKFGFHSKKGGYDVMVHKELLFNGGNIFGLDKKMTDYGEFPAAVVIDGAQIGVEDTDLTARGLKPEVYYVTVTDSSGRKRRVRRVRYELLWKAPVPFGRAYFKAGSQIYGGGRGAVAAVQIPPEDRAVRITWQAAVPGTVWNMLAADDRLFVVTTEGRLLCFGPDRAELKTYEPADAARPARPADTPQARLADTILDTTGVKEGYCVALDAGDGLLVERLLARSNLHVIAIDPDAKKIAALRRRLDDAGLYGVRASAHVGDAAGAALPPYLASLIVCPQARGRGGSGDPPRGGSPEPPRPGHRLRKVFASLRPYGGMACFAARGGGAPAFAQRLLGLKLPGAQVGVVAGRGEQGGLVVLRRKGPLPGSADWTHQYADAGNSAVSEDTVVRAPLGLLWFGGPANDKILPRHGHGPSPHVVGGRLIIQGPDILRAVDVYTGRLLWEVGLPGIGEYHDNTSHQPGAGGIGGNYVSLPDGIYVAYGKVGLRLEPATGRKVKEFRLPEVDEIGRPYWGYVAVADDVLVAGSTPMKIRARFKRDRKTRKSKIVGVDVAANARYARGSKHLVAMDRHSGEALWTRPAEENFRHNAIAVGKGKVFCIDKISKWRNDLLRRRGIEPAETARLLALDLQTGKVVWQTDDDVFGTWLGYSPAHDVLLQAGSRFRDREIDEVGTGMVAYRGATGRVLWKDLRRRYGGPPILWKDRIICQGPAYELLTGKPARRTHALTGEPLNWGFRRTYGCNTAIASRHLLTFRSGAAGYYDLARDGGTGNFGGFKSGCTANLVVANGVLNAPDYTRTCTCAYQNQSSLALVPTADVEMWTFSSYGYKGRPVRRVGLNFGAPGDRLADGGTLWLDCPSVGGPSPNVPVKITPKEPDVFRYHSSRMRGGELTWVAASGLRGVRSITIRLANPKSKPAPAERSYTVRLHFAELDDHARPGGRGFQVALQGRTVLEDFDILKAAGGPRRGIVREFKGVAVTDDLEVTFQPAKDAPADAAGISGMEIIQEEREQG